MPEPFALFPAFSGRRSLSSDGAGDINGFLKSGRSAGASYDRLDSNTELPFSNWYELVAREAARSNADSPRQHPVTVH